MDTPDQVRERNDPGIITMLNELLQDFYEELKEGTLTIVESDVETFNKNYGKNLKFDAEEIKSILTGAGWKCEVKEEKDNWFYYRDDDNVHKRRKIYFVEVKFA